MAPLRFAVCVGRFHEDLAERLLSGAREGFELAGVPASSVSQASVPGAYELPFAAKLQARTGRFAGIACLGVVIRGETDHYDFVCAEAARGIQDVQLGTGVPCAFGVITCDTMEQALARAGGGKRDQGRSTALTVARMALLQRQLG
ncbi:MAG: 6,7-dimethyl-8-ribityllumazine synthase [Solirubrobacterales bacterium]|nr:6,7-dimethyl-8-ribityllumazine synthase [Solirubrobacterales bacterium]